MFSRILTLVIKELETLLQDRQSRLLLIVPVLLQLALFPFAATLEVKNNTLAVYNEDHGRESAELIQRFSQTRAFTRLLNLHSEAAVRRAIDNQVALLVLRFPPDFSRDVAADRPSKIQAILDGRRSNSGQIALGYVQQIINDFTAERLDSRQKVAPSILNARYWFNPNLEYHWHILPCLIAIITSLNVLIVTALSVAREREQGTLDQLLVSPLTPGMIMIGKIIPAILVAILQGTIVLLGAIFFYRIPFQGSFMPLYGSMIFYSLALAGFGLLISSVCATQQQAFLGVFSFLMPAILLSGYATPVDNMPAWLQCLDWVNPMRHFIVIAKGLFLKDFSHVALFHSLYPLLVIAIGTLAAADWLLRKRLA
ncbi:MAG TPA: ABC transporter permease [Candidatus Paceibacterota bacterium]|nr:ABC transporter permease [Verrucomicrobiota bacterium]HSA12477.1 ABC transporter permease [Candidatus Paceibacterota bacterium]